MSSCLTYDIHIIPSSQIMSEEGNYPDPGEGPSRQSDSNNTIIELQNSVATLTQQFKQFDKFMTFMMSEHDQSSQSQADEPDEQQIPDEELIETAPRAESETPETQPEDNFLTSLLSKYEKKRENLQTYHKQPS